jgi:predicted dehydrogenase
MTRLAVIGASQIADEHIRAAISAGFLISGIAASPHSINAKNLARKFDTTFFSDYKELLFSDLGFDAVLISTKPAITTKILSDLQDFNLPILCEKPVSLNLESLKVVEPLSAHMYVAYNRRFYPGVNFLKSEIDLSVGSATFRIFEPRVDKWENDDSNNPIINNSVHVLDLVGHLAGTHLMVDSWVDSSQTMGRFIYEGFAGVQVSIEVFLGYPGNTSVEIYSDDKIFQLKPLEKLTIFNGLRVELDDFGRRSYLPEISRREELNFKENQNLKPGFEGMWKEFYGVTKNGATPSNLGTYHDSLNALTKAIQISNKFRNA